jgi:hypothetical protein
MKVNTKWQARRRAIFGAGPAALLGGSSEPGDRDVPCEGRGHVLHPLQIRPTALRLTKPNPEAVPPLLPGQFGDPERL